MKINESKSTMTQADCVGDRQNRREFFNGLGKWSMILVAAVSFLRGSDTSAQASHEQTPRPEPVPQRPAWTVPEDRGEKLQVRRYAKGGAPHVNEYIKMGHDNTPHVNHKVIE